MSFFRSFYCRTPHSDTVRTDSFVTDASNVEEYMEEDGFVVYTEKKTNCVMSTGPPGASKKIEYNYLQNSSASQSFPASGPLQTSINYNYNYGSYMDTYTKKAIPQHESKTFLTASDIPMKLSKHLEMVSTESRKQYTSYYNHNRPDIQQFYYDFHLEKKTLEDCSFR